MRRRRADKREVLADAKYNSVLVAKFINMVMLRGKKSIAERIAYKCLETIGAKSGKPPLEVFQKALDNVKPLLEVKPRRIGGATYQVPISVKNERGLALAMMWIRNFARTKKGRPMEEKLADEFLEAYKGEGPAVKKRDDTHKMAEANKAFAHYRW